MANYLILAFALSLAVSAGCASQAKPQGITSQELSFSGAGGLQLSGTFEMPARSGPVPAFLLLPGSGPTDRDGNSIVLPDVKVDLLKQIADKLAQEGIASFRFDKRAILRYKSSWPLDPVALGKFFSYQNFIDDAKAAYATLQSQKGVDKSKTGIIGHSEGGLFALQLAKDMNGQPGAPYKLVLLGTAGRTLGPVIHDQLTFRLNAPGVPKSLADELLGYSDKACAALIAGKPLPPNEPAQLQSLYNPTVIDLMTAYLTVDPIKLAKSYQGTALLVNGEDDTQVSPTKDSQPLYAAFGSQKAKLVIVPKASHCLKSTADGNKDQFAGPIVPQALDEIITYASK
jgi:pimeloyl-ACP methyl ester carboxylesterase